MQVALVSKRLRNTSEHLLFARLTTLGDLLTASVQVLRASGTADAVAASADAATASDETHDVPAPTLTEGAMR